MDMTLTNDFARARDLRRELRALEDSISRRANATPVTAEDEHRMSAMQARADASYAAAARRAPPPLPLERPEEYRRRLVDGVRELSPRWRNADVRGMRDDALTAVEGQIYADALENGRRHGLRLGEFRERVVQNSTGHTIIEFDGAEGTHFVDQFNRRAPRAEFKSPSEYTQMIRDANMARIDEIIRYRAPLHAPRAAF
jgi:hypothetical protein